MHQVRIVRGLPFEIKQRLPIELINDYKAEAEYSLQQANEGKLTSFDLHELEALEDMDNIAALEFINTRRRESNL